ncbi:hypothetical protein CGLO_13295 [Colletotrichum gloeosporioides Cg-14]|uniref:Uncharacterized protein n=1 Tax=Colletotrichum gloeosporioides (strain Cg-14) TaxID=1237896 RepID=T0JWU8_COLGC|nr:hypothetical protein CGLO_13295 [Colletotrichum gloeosporioides Cg-14]
MHLLIIKHALIV